MDQSFGLWLTAEHRGFGDAFSTNRWISYIAANGRWHSGGFFCFFFGLPRQLHEQVDAKNTTVNSWPSCSNSWPVEITSSWCSVLRLTWRTSQITVSYSPTKNCERWQLSTVTYEWNDLPLGRNFCWHTRQVMEMNSQYFPFWTIYFELYIIRINCVVRHRIVISTGKSKSRSTNNYEQRTMNNISFVGKWIELRLTSTWNHFEETDFICGLLRER